MTWLEKSRLALDKYCELSSQLLQGANSSDIEKKRNAAFHNFRCYDHLARKENPKECQSSEYLGKIRKASELNNELLNHWKNNAEQIKSQKKSAHKTIQVVQRYQINKPSYSRFKTGS